MSNSVLNSIDLILSVGGNALGYSTGCKISTSTETGERVTKEASAGKWKEKYVKSFSETISADGVVLTDGTTDMPTYDQLKAMQMAGVAVEASYSVKGCRRTRGEGYGRLQGQLHHYESGTGRTGRG